jgi:hypothetical protein
MATATNHSTSSEGQGIAIEVFPTMLLGRSNARSHRCLDHRMFGPSRAPLGCYLVSILGRLDTWIASMLAWTFWLAGMLVASMVLLASILASMLASMLLVASILGRLVVYTRA